MRDSKWLQDELEFILKKYFSNVLLTNPIEIKFGREAKYRFGSIKLISHKNKGIRRLFKPVNDDIPKKSLITITSMFRDETIPIGVVRYTIAHELCHYAHGFSSANKRLFRYPHHGGIINKELKERGAEELIPVFKTWLAAYRKKILAQRIKI